MKRINIAATALLVLGLSVTAYAEMGKCGGTQQGNMQQGGMMMNGDMGTSKSMMLKHLDDIKACVNAASTMQELRACKMKMQQNAPMMQGRQMMQPQNGGTTKCGANK